MHKIILIVLLTLFLISPSSYGVGKKLIFEDRAVLRVSDSVLFLSDVRDRVNDLKLFKCVAPKSLLLSSLKIDHFNFSQLKVDKSGPKKLFKGLASLEILFSFIEKQGVFIDEKFLTNLNLKRCKVSSVDSWPKQLALLIKVESFLNDRFVLGKVRANQSLDDLSRKRVDDAIRSFMLSLAKQTKVHMYL